MLGGDGLSYMRLIHRLSQAPQLFLESMPVIIPRLGENPHGKFHLMHGDWRLWAPLLMKLANVVGNTAVREDPTVEMFNHHEHFLRIVTTALAKYVVQIASTGSDYHFTEAFMQAADRNLSFAYIVNFLFLFAFKYLEFRDAVRRNQSKKLDLLWRENLASAKSAPANKTNYRQMTVVLVYWGTSLREPLQLLYHNTRTIRWVHSHVGWDMPIEKLNMWIREAVVAQITEAQISKFIRRLNFCHVVTRGIATVVHANRKSPTAKLKDIDADVNLILKFLQSKIGTTFEQATQPSDDNLLQLDMSNWGGNQNARISTPWASMQRGMQEYREYVAQQITKLCPWHHWL